MISNEIQIAELVLNDYFDFFLVGAVAGFLISFMFILFGLGVSGALKILRQA